MRAPRVISWSLSLGSRLRVKSTRYYGNAAGRDLMLCSVAQMTGQWDDDSSMAKFQTIIYLLGLLVRNPAIYFVLILNEEALLMGFNIDGSQVRARRLWRCRQLLVINNFLYFMLRPIG